MGMGMRMGWEMEGYGMGMDRMMWDGNENWMGNWIGNKFEKWNGDGKWGEKGDREER